MTKIYTLDMTFQLENLELLETKAIIFPFIMVFGLQKY